MPHPDADTLRHFAACRLAEDREEEIEQHLADCPDCRKRLAELENTGQGSIVQEMRAAMQEPPPVSDASGSCPRSETGGFASGDWIGDNYRLEIPLGRGGMGVAWKAFDTTADRHVVLKFVPKEIQHAAEAMNAVRESFRRVHALQHQHICPLYGLFDDPDAGLFLIMKFVDGPTLGEYRRRRTEENETIPFGEIVRILRPMAEALDYAHERKVIHRDIKPQNVMISPTDGVQIIDFGLADEIRSSMERLTGSVGTKAIVTKISGTRPYMAPEQWQGQPQDARTDQYALAITAYELFAGHVPFQSDNSDVLRQCVLTELPKSIPGLPDTANAALFKALSKNRADRFEDCKSFVDALAGFSQVPPQSVTVWRRKLFAAGILISILVLCGFFLILSVSKSPDTQSTVSKPLKEQVKEQGGTALLASLPVEEAIEQRKPEPDEVGLDSIPITPNKTASSSKIQWTIPKRNSDPILSIARLTLEIDADGRGRFTMSGGSSLESPDIFRGTAFSSPTMFHKAQTYKGENGLGRVFFDFRDYYPSPMKLSPPCDWIYEQESHEENYYNPQDKSFRFVCDPSVKEYAGLVIGKGKLPCRITLEVSGDHLLPYVETNMMMKVDGKLKRGAVGFDGRLFEDGSMRILGSFSLEGEKTPVISFDNTPVSRTDKGFFKDFQLPKELIDKTERIVHGVYCYAVDKEAQAEFEIISLDIVGRFGGSTGLTLADQEEEPVIQTVAENSPAIHAGLKTGDKILQLNSETGSTTKIRKKLDDLNFGDLVEIEVGRNGESKSFQFYAE